VNSPIRPTGHCSVTPAEIDAGIPEAVHAGKIAQITQPVVIGAIAPQSSMWRKSIAVSTPPYRAHGCVTERSLVAVCLETLCSERVSIHLPGGHRLFSMHSAQTDIADNW